MNTTVNSSVPTTKTRRKRTIRLPRTLVWAVVFAGAALILAIIPHAMISLAVYSGNTVFLTIDSILAGIPTHYALYIGIAAITGYRYKDTVDALLYGFGAAMFFDYAYGLFCWLAAFLPFAVPGEAGKYSIMQYVLSWHILHGSYWFYLELVLIAFIAYGGYRLRKLHAHGKLRDFFAGPLIIASIAIVTLILVSGLVQWFGYTPTRVSTIRSATSILFAVITFICLIHEYPSDARGRTDSDG